MAGIFNLTDWVINAVGNTKIDEVTRDLHVSEIFNYKSLSISNKLLKSFEVFNDVVKIISTIDTRGLCIYLSIDLKSNNTALSIPPKSIEDFRLLLNTKTVPEIIIYKPFMPEFIGLVELYRMPILFRIHDFEKNVNVFYKEYRTKNEIIGNENFNRELNFVYSPN